MVNRDDPHMLRAFEAGDKRIPISSVPTQNQPRNNLPDKHQPSGYQQVDRKNQTRRGRIGQHKCAHENTTRLFTNPSSCSDAKPTPQFKLYTLHGRQPAQSFAQQIPPMVSATLSGKHQLNINTLCCIHGSYCSKGVLALSTHSLSNRREGRPTKDDTIEKGPRLDVHPAAAYVRCVRAVRHL